MKDLILKKLSEIEERERVKILFCAESGSRAWGFASPDSDYDVRFIYVRPQEEYLRLDPRRDVIEWQLDDTLDINGWDFKKALALAHKSNPALLEWCGSPIVYKSTEGWEHSAHAMRECFDKKAGLYHYLSMAKDNYKGRFREGSVIYKRYFYVLRPLLACRFILAEGTPPPIEFAALTAAHLPADLCPEVERLLDLKMHSPELAVGAPILPLNEYIDTTIAEVEAAATALAPTPQRPWDTLNKIFIAALR